jgi:hypothetical protein
MYRFPGYFLDATTIGEDERVTRSAASDDTRAKAPPSMLYLVKQLELAVRSRLDEVLRPVSITPLQYTALTVLERRSDLSTAEMVAVLEDRGLVLRHPDPGDRRRRVLRLTAPGQQLLDQVRADVDAVEERMLSPLADDEADDLRRYVVACRGALWSAPPH